MKGRIKSTGEIVEIKSHYMPKRKNAPSRDWVYVTTDDRHIDAPFIELIKEDSNN